jgi:hypothetical protein
VTGAGGYVERIPDTLEHYGYLTLEERGDGI